MNIKPPSVTEWFRSDNLDNYIDFDKDLLNIADSGKTNLNMRLTFVLSDRQAYISLSWQSNDHDPEEMLGHHIRGIDWNAAIKLLGEEIELPEELK